MSAAKREGGGVETSKTEETESNAPKQTGVAKATSVGKAEGQDKKEEDKEIDAEQEGGKAIEAEHVNYQGVDYGLLPNGSLYTEGGEYVGKWDPVKKKILSKEELDHQHLLHRLDFAPQELKGLEGCFDLIDEDKSGTLDFEEIKKMLSVTGCKFDDSVLLKIFPHSDTVGITAREFINMCSQNKDHPKHREIIQTIMASAEKFAKKTFTKDEILDRDEMEQLRLLLRKHSYGASGFNPQKIFERWDKDKDGKLDFDEMHDLIFSLGPDISEAEFEQFFQYIDHDSDDFIHRIEFGAFVNKVPKQKVVRKKNREVTNAQGNTHFMNGMREDKSGEKLKRFDGRATGEAGWSADDTLDESEILTVKKKIRSAAYFGPEGRDVKRLFLEWDKDGNGVLDREELEFQLKRCLPKSGITEEELSQLIDKVDTGGDGQIQVDEFVKFVESNPVTVIKSNGRNTITSSRDVKDIVESRAAFSPAELVELQKSFQSVDKDSSGTIDNVELSTIFKVFGVELTESDINSMMRHVDINNDGVIDFGEFIIMCAKAKKGKEHNEMFDKLAAFSHVASEKMGNADNILDSDELDQIRIRWRTLGYTTRGLDIEGLFNLFDRDKDGKLCYDDLHYSMKIPGELSEEEFSQFFNYLDHDDDDYIRIPEFKAFVLTAKARGARKRVEKELTLAMAGSMFNNGVRDNLVKNPIITTKWNPDGVLDDSEIRMIKRKIRAASYGPGGQNIERLFKSWDKSQNGNLDLDEITLVLKKILPKAGISDQELKQFMELLDTNKNGEISLTEFEEFLKPDCNGQYVSAKKAEKRKARQERKMQQEKDREESLKAAKAKSNGPVRKVDTSHTESNEYKLVHTVRETFNLQEINHMKKQFERLDKDRSKKLDVHEVSQMFALLKIDISKKAIEELIKSADIDGKEDGEIDVKEFLYMCALAKNSDYANEFAALTRNVEERAKKNAPKFSEFDLQQILLNFRDAARTLRGIEPQKLFKRLDRDGDGVLNDQEFRRAVKSIMPDLSPAQYDEFHRYMDTANKGYVALPEFCHFIDKKPTVKRVAQARGDAFSSSFRPNLAKAHDILSGKLQWTEDKNLPQEHILQTQSTILSRSYKMYGTDLESLFNLWDRDVDGKLSFKEFYTGLRKFLDLKSFTRREYVALWQHLDRTKNGYIELDELRAFLETDYFDYGVADCKRLSAEELDMLKHRIKSKAYGPHGEDLYKLFQKWDADNSRSLSKKEFRKFLMKMLPGVLDAGEINAIIQILQGSSENKTEENDVEISYEAFEAFVNSESKTITKKSTKKPKTFVHVEPDIFDQLMPSELLNALEVSHSKRTDEQELDKLLVDLGMTYENEDEASKLQKAYPDSKFRAPDQKVESGQQEKKDGIFISEYGAETWRIRDDDPDELLDNVRHAPTIISTKHRTKIDKFFTFPDLQNKSSISPTNREFSHGIFSMPQAVDLKREERHGDDFDLSWKDLNIEHIDHVLEERQKLQEIMQAAKIDQIYTDQKLYPRYQYEEHTSHDKFIDTLTGKNAPAYARERQKLLTKGMSTEKLSPTKSFGTQTIRVKKKRRRRRKKITGSKNLVMPSPPMHNISGTIAANSSPRAGKHINTS